MLRQCLTILLLSLAGGALPLFASRSQRLLHLVIALAAGIFLGVVFLHLLPEVAELAASQDSSRNGGLPSQVVWLFLLIGVAGLALLEHTIFEPGHESEHRRHRTLSYASCLGLSIHSFLSGLGLSAAGRIPDLELPLYLSVASHKLAESFSLATVFLLAGYSTRRILVLMLLFGCTTPAGILAGGWVVGNVSVAGVAALTSLAAGTFLFVALNDLLPEVFHRREDVAAKAALLGAGAGISYLLGSFGL